MAVRTWQYSVSFENPSSGAPTTIRGEIASLRAATAASRAIREAMTRQPGQRWTSLVLLLEKRQPADTEK